MNIHIGISADHRQKIAEGLSHLLADSYTLYLKTQNYHWNVTGSMFQSLHLLFETQYQDLATAVDEIAERIRALDFKAPGSYSEFAKLSSIKEETGKPSAKEMIQNLCADQEIIVKTANKVFEIAEAGNDQATIDMVTERLQTHEKNAWMLRSLLG